MAEKTEVNPKGAGRPAKPEDAKEIWDKEIIQLVKLSRRAREFAGEQLEKLQEEAKQPSGLKQRLEIVRASTQLVESLSKTSKMMMEQLATEPKENEDTFDLLALLNTQK